CMHGLEFPMYSF
nr:immunoglobulin light chain junction region [Macaca mulatta]MOW09210.1 immunoglobulin light chain junction region [Macaca mulatta]MOW09556.1 immunoglobulin light chain junction region [Macaca mulatta]MOW10570.1 immunoglobulin light chain junction region [Macaca mulatta]MOW11932.1 immunoglobulin light chain junction region [Macaca mulatta]